eukprot:gnl/TRDRNA2_/TRDRNA2_171221_c2_seq1.p1 gnl/TRDRNA2_/TRDRNA2_171221_c2~~gnl/TRDRNA2_/TRDRNA2_171221_c2_seq1.p1  ORF type:complete len:162 (+),score=30.65 gnl/TRDRNA2_/TRDRNA2_171221_c2_seq1:67-552(+)
MLEQLQSVKDAGLADTHWIVDVLRAAVAVQTPALACEMLRARIAANGPSHAHAVTKCARLRLALGEALCAKGDSDSLREAVEVYADAAETLAQLFGDDHPEHHEAASLCRMTARKIASLELASVPQPGSSRTAPERVQQPPQPGIIQVPAKSGRKKGGRRG